jgi:hypothetical protein
MFGLRCITLSFFPDSSPQGAHLEVDKTFTKFESADHAVGNDSEPNVLDPRRIRKVFRIEVSR